MAVQPACKFDLENLVDIKVDKIEAATPDQRKKLVLREALVQWKESVQELEGKEEKRTKRIDGLTNEIYQLVGLYSVFVGVVFTAVLQSDRVKCQHIWSPVVLCLVAFLVILFVIVTKSNQIEKNLATIQLDVACRRLGLTNLSILKRKGHSNFEFSEHVVVKQEKPNKDKKDKKDKLRGSRKLLVIISLLTFFTLVLLFSFVHILCINTTSRCTCSSSPPIS